MIALQTGSVSVQGFVNSEELLRTVQSRTYWQVADLRIDCDNGRVKMTGRTSTFYLKQLATQAIRAAFPAVTLENEILVCTG